MNPSDSRLRPLRFRFLMRNSRWPPHLPKRVSSTGQSIFEYMPTLLPRESTNATSVISASAQRPSPSVHRVGVSISFTRLLMGSLALRPALLLFGNSRPRVTTTPLPHATGAYGQLPGRDFNPLDLLLLLRTDRKRFFQMDGEGLFAKKIFAISEKYLTTANFNSSICPDGDGDISRCCRGFGSVESFTISNISDLLRGTLRLDHRRSICTREG